VTAAVDRGVSQRAIALRVYEGAAAA